MLKRPADLGQNCAAYLAGFSANVKNIIYNFSGGEEKGLGPIYETLLRKRLLFKVTQAFAEADLSPMPWITTAWAPSSNTSSASLSRGAAAPSRHTARDSKRSAHHLSGLPGTRSIHGPDLLIRTDAYANFWPVFRADFPITLVSSSRIHCSTC
jgi:hypothetical protein